MLSGCYSPVGPRMWALFAFKVRAFGGSSLRCRYWKVRCPMWGSRFFLLGRNSGFWVFFWLWHAVRGVGFILRLYVCFHVVSCLPLSLTLGFLKRKTCPYVALNSVCLWEEVSLGSSCVAILNSNFSRWNFKVKKWSRSVVSGSLGPHGL